MVVGHREAEHDAEQHEHHDVRISGRGQCRLAQVMTDPDGIDRAVERLQHVAEQDRQRKASSAGGIDPSVSDSLCCTLPPMIRPHCGPSRSLLGSGAGLDAILGRHDSGHRRRQYAPQVGLADHHADSPTSRPWCTGGQAGRWTAALFAPSQKAQPRPRQQRGRGSDAQAADAPLEAAFGVKPEFITAAHLTSS